MRSLTGARAMLSGVAFLAVASSRPALAFDSVVLTADTVTTPAARLRGLRVALALAPAAARTDAAVPSARLSAARLDLGRSLGRYTSVDLACAEFRISAGRIACRGGRLTAHGGIIDPLALRADAVLDPSRGQLAFRASGIAVAGGNANVSGTVAAGGHWAIRGQGTALEASAIRRLAARWVAVPDYTLSGRVDTDFDVESGTREMPGGRAARRIPVLQVGIEARTSALGLSNAAGTIASEQLAATIAVTAQIAPQAILWQTDVQGEDGQLLVGPVLADFHGHPLTLHASGLASGRSLDIDAFSVSQHALIDATGSARLTLGSAPGSRPIIAHAQVRVARLDFPAAYASFLQLPLAATDFAALRTAGRASGRFEISNGRPVRIEADIDRLDIADPGSRLSADDLTASLHWAAAGPVAPSVVSFHGGRAYGIEIGPTRLDFRTSGLGFQLTHEARIPVFDGAIVVHTLGAARLGRPDAQLQFDATIEPIGMPHLCKAFGWPQMEGSLSGRVPGLRYHNRELTFGGDVVAHVFDGTIRGSRIRMSDPLGPWPRLHADIIARDLDLDLVTRTFPIGSITGHLDADIDGLDLFDWSPVDFDARLFTAPGDRSRHLISQKAVTSLSSLGGGGGIVTAALQSGVLRFFRTFHYDRIGLRCVLSNEVCLMSGLEPADDGGYYIVKGRGLPRIDVIGNQGRVSWPQLVSQVESAMHGGDLVVH